MQGSTPDEAKAMVGGSSIATRRAGDTGQITKRHGASDGHLIATFKRGLPGDAIGTPVKITTK